MQCNRTAPKRPNRRGCLHRPQRSRGDRRLTRERSGFSSVQRHSLHPWQNPHMIRVAAVADIHAGPETAGSLAPLLSGLRDEADILFLAGDLTRAGKPAEAEILATELAEVGIPIVAVLGNHDYH